MKLNALLKFVDEETDICIQEMVWENECEYGRKCKACEHNMGGNIYECELGCDIGEFVSQFKGIAEDTPLRLINKDVVRIWNSRDVPEIPPITLKSPIIQILVK